MGNTSSFAIEESKDICAINKAIHTKKKIDQGVSPSTLYEVQFKKNTTYKGVPITNALY